MGIWAGPQRLGKYELRERLGYGGVAEVWKAFDTELRRYVAVKLLHADLQADPEFLIRFSREARFIAALHHPNIVQIYDFQTGRHKAQPLRDLGGETLPPRDPGGEALPSHDPRGKTLPLSHPGGETLPRRDFEMDTPVAYMVMDYVEGGTLAHYIHVTSRVGQFPAPIDIVHLFASISKAIDYAHQEGMIHRDIKPSNILLDKRHAASNSIGEPVLTDFGIAKIIGTSSGTISGTWLGTPQYVSPEQAQGYPGTEYSDIYSLGVILYEICTGVCPFRGDNVTAIMAQKIVSAPISPAYFNPTIPPALTTTILRAIAKNPAERFRSASAMTAEIAKAFHLSLPEGLLLPADPTNPPLVSAHLGVDLSSRSPYITLPMKQQSLPKALTGKFPSSPPASHFWRTWKGNLLVWFVVLFLLVGSTLVSTNLLSGGQASATMPSIVGTLMCTDSGQYDPDITVGYNDIVTLSLHNLTTPETGMAYFAWFMPDKGDDTTVPLLLGHFSVNAGNATLHYASPTHTNLLAKYSGVRITEQSANTDPGIPSPDPKTWRWEGWIPHKPTPGDDRHFSFLSHLRHLLAKDPTLQANNISGGLVIWMTRNVAKVGEWSSAAQGSWGDGNADLIHRQLLRILDYLDGQAYVGQDVPAGSPWLVDPLAGKLGLLSYTQGQQPPGYLQHVEIHLNGLAASPGHTQEQRQLAIQVDGIIARMIDDLTQVRKDAVQLVQRSNAELLQPDALILLNEMTTLTREVNGGWFDATTHENQGGTIWLSAQIQQLGTIALTASNQHNRQRASHCVDKP